MEVMGVTRALATAVVFLVVSGACGDDDEGGRASTTSVPPDTTEGTATTEPPGPGEGEEALGEPTTGPVETEGFPDGAERSGRLLTDVRVAGHDGFDRVVFELGDGLPDYRVEYVDPPIIEDPTGETLEVDGSAFLRVTMTASGVDLSGPEAVEVYEGPDRIAPADADVARELVASGDFEGILSWVAGLDQRVDFGVAELDDPPRLVIDLRAPGS